MTQPFDNRDWDVRQIAEKDAEIERLKEGLEMQTTQAMQFRDLALSHRALLARAADALKPYQLGFPDGSSIRDLIDELRKAAG